MKLMTRELERKFPSLGATEAQADPMVVAKFFHPTSSYTFYATEYDPGQRLLFGYVQLYEGKWGYVSLDELESVSAGPLGLGIERDLYFTPAPISKFAPDAVRYKGGAKEACMVKFVQKLAAEITEEDVRLAGRGHLIGEPNDKARV